MTLNRPQLPTEPLPMHLQQQLKDYDHEQMTSQFTEDEITNLKEIFDLFDHEKQGCINVSDLETIMGSLRRDPAEVREFINNIDPNSTGFIGFPEFLELMQNIENRIVK